MLSLLLTEPLKAQSEAIANLAEALSQNDAVNAMASFDARMKDFSAIEADIEALTAQTEILCAIDTVEEKTEGDVHKLDVDWYMQLKSLATEGPTERRRQRVALTIEKVKGKWKITSLQPLSILAPIQIVVASH